MPAGQVSATPAEFERQVQHLAENYDVVSLEDVLGAQRGDLRLPPRAVLLTFDDACRDFGDTAWPILQAHGLSATVFVPTAYAADPARAFWWDRIHRALRQTERRAVTLAPFGTLDLDTPAARNTSFHRVSSVLKMQEHYRAMEVVEELLEALDVEERAEGDVLSWSRLRELARQGVSVAAHSQTHAALTQLDADGIAREVAGSLEDVSREIGLAPPVFCYPFGLHDREVVSVLADHGIALAFTCLDGHNDFPTLQPLRLRRTEVTPRTTGLVFRARLTRPATYVDMWRHRHKYPPFDGPVPGQADLLGPQPHGAAPRVAYIMSRFPKLSETFVLNEMAALEGLGATIELFPLLRERQPVAHPEAERWTRRARFQPFISPRIVRALSHFAIRQPRTLIRTLYEVLRGTIGSWNFFVGAMGIFPKSVRFAYEMRQLDIEHVHAHFATHPAVAALIIRRLTGIPFSFTAHGSDLHVDRRMLPKKVDAAAFVVTVSDFNREIIVEDCGEAVRSKVHVVRCGVDPDFFSPSEQRPDGAPLEIVCVASFEEVKGHRFLIEACRMLRERGVPFRCHLIGDGPLRESVTSQIESHGLQGPVLVHGGLPRADVAATLRSADVAVLASHPTADGKREGIPVALMEAMACGLPVVASAISGIPELVDDGETGILIPSGEAEALANALERLAGDRALRARMGTSGRARILGEYSLRANAERLLDLIQSRHAPAAVSHPKDRGTSSAAEVSVSDPVADAGEAEVGISSPSPQC